MIDLQLDKPFIIRGFRKCPPRFTNSWQLDSDLAANGIFAEYREIYITIERQETDAEFRERIMATTLQNLPEIR